MSGHAVRQNYLREFTGLKRNSQLSAFAIVTNYVAQVVIAMGVGYWILQQPTSWFTWIGVALAVFFIGTRLRGFNNIVHECTHGTFTQEREDNVLLGSFCASMVLSCYHDYRDEHMTHHAHLGDYEKDMDLKGIRDLHLEEQLSAKTILRHVVTPFVGLHLPFYLGMNLSGRDGVGFRYFKMGLISTAIVFMLVDPIAALLLVWIPFLWVYSSINYWTDCMDHAGLLENGDELEASRNILAPLPLKLLLFPRNDCYHLVHHLFPQVPSGQLEQCHQKLLTNPNYSARNPNYVDSATAQSA